MRLGTLFALLLFSIIVRADGPDKQTPEEIAAAKAVIAHDFAGAIDPESLNEWQKFVLTAPYSTIDPNHEVPADLLKNALTYLAANSSGFPNQNYIVVVDFKPRSDAYR